MSRYRKSGTLMWFQISAFLAGVLSVPYMYAQKPDRPAQPATLDAAKAQATKDQGPQLSEMDKFLACPAGGGVLPDPQGVQKIGGSVKPPKVLNQVDAAFPKDFRKTVRKRLFRSFQAVSIVTFVVDTEGNPQSLCVQKPAGYGLDGEAMKAVRRYRFEPATKDGKPIPARLQVEVTFRLY